MSRKYLFHFRFFLVINDATGRRKVRMIFPNERLALEGGSSGTSDHRSQTQPSMVKQSEMASFVLGTLASDNVCNSAKYTGRGG